MCPTCFENMRTPTAARVKIGDFYFCPECNPAPANIDEIVATCDRVRAAFAAGLADGTALPHQPRRVPSTGAFERYAWGAVVKNCDFELTAKMSHADFVSGSAEIAAREMGFKSGAHPVAMHEWADARGDGVSCWQERQAPEIHFLDTRGGFVWFGAFMRGAPFVCPRHLEPVPYPHAT